MVVVSQLVGRISIDGADAARSALSSVGRAVDNVRSNLASSFASATRNAGANLLNLGERLGMAAFAFSELGRVAVGAAQALFEPNAAMEQTETAFRTLLGSGKAATKMMKDLWDFAATTPFEFPGLADNAKKMLAFGFSAQSIIPMMRNIGDAVSALGGGSVEIDRVTLALGQMKAKSKVSAEEMLQLTEIGIPAWQMLADGMGLTTAEVMKLSERGLIPADKAINVLLAGMNKTFGGGMQAQSQTFNGILSTFKDNVLAAWRAFTGPLFEQAKGGLQQMAALVTSPAFQQFATMLGERVGGAIQFVVNVLKAANAWIGSFTGTGSALIPVLTGLGAVLAMVLVPAMWSLAAGVIAATWPFLLVGAAVASATAIFLHFYNANAPFRDFINNIGTTIQNVAKAIYDWVASGSALNDTMAALQPTIAYLAPKFQELGAAFVNLRDVAMPVIQKIGESLAQFGQKTMESGIPMKVLEVVITGITLAIGFLVDGLTWLANGLSNVIAFFSTGGSNAKWLWDALAGIGNFLVTSFTPVWDQLVTTFQTQLLPAWTQLSAAFQQAMPLFQFIGGIILSVLVVALGILVGVITGIVGAIAGMLPGIIQAFGGLVQFVSGIVQIVLGIASFFVNLFTGKFDRLAGDLMVICTGIQTMFAGMWNMIGGLFSAAVGFLYGLVSGFITGIIGFFVTLWHALVGGSIVPDMINGIVSWFAQLPGRVGAFVMSLIARAIALFTMLWSAGIKLASDLVNGVVRFFSQLPGKAAEQFNSMKDRALNVLNGLISSAKNAGSNVVKGIADGIRAGIGWVTDAINAVVSAITDHLPHSPAKVGPLKLLPEQGEEITTQISEGMLSGMPQLRSALGDLVGPISLSMTPGASPQGVQAMPPSFAPASVPAMRGDGRPIVLEIDGRAFARGFLPYEVETIRSVVGVRF